jgi:predicted phosphodiesterase
MRSLLQKIFRPFFTWLAAKLTSSPKKEQVHESLSTLIESIAEKPGKRGIVLECDIEKDSFIIFSDQHKGNRNASDDFASNEINYLAALEFYYQKKFTFINLGDSEELWKYTADNVIAKNGENLKAEAKFQELGKFYKTFGNHDLIWKNKLDVDIYFKGIFQLPLPIYEGIVIKTQVEQKPLSIFLTHGHQGDKMSDNNAFSTWIVAHIWNPIQRYLRINVNTPAKDYRLLDKHNIMMYEWSSTRGNLMLITGHTHKPVFASGRYTSDGKQPAGISEKFEREVRPTYFNTGCCCFNDGDITGIEIDAGEIRLVKWHQDSQQTPKRMVLENAKLCELLKLCKPSTGE